MKEKIDNIKGIGFVFDNCHKLYVCEDTEDFEKAKEFGYDTLYPMEDLYVAFINSCPLRFISNWKLTEQFVKQCEFEEDDIYKELLKDKEEK